MARICSTCGRSKHKGLCNLVTLSDGTTVHADRIDSFNGDVRARIDDGEVKVVNRWIKKPDPKKKARRS
jgi:hypothetical protein